MRPSFRKGLAQLPTNNLGSPLLAKPNDLWSSPQTQHPRERWGGGRAKRLGRPSSFSPKSRGPFLGPPARLLPFQHPRAAPSSPIPASQAYKMGRGALDGHGGDPSPPPSNVFYPGSSGRRDSPLLHPRLPIRRPRPVFPQPPPPAPPPTPDRLTAPPSPPFAPSPAFLLLLLTCRLFDFAAASGRPPRAATGREGRAGFPPSDGAAD